VHCYAHFPKDFLKPYGAATTSGMATPSDFKSKLGYANCERFTRPGYALTELQETISEKWSTVKNDLTCVADENVIKEIGKDFEKLGRVLMLLKEENVA